MLVLLALFAGFALVSQPIGTAVAQDSGNVPGQALGTSSDSELWRAVRKGTQGNVSIQDKQAGVMIQSEGENWRAWRNGPISTFGGWLLLGMFAALALFFAIRGRIKIEAGESGRKVLRFNDFERFVHWLAAVSFIILGLTGLNLLYGRYVIKPVIGDSAFAAITLAGKYAHNYVGFAFMLSIVLIVVIWIRENLPDKHDLRWLVEGGGMFGGGHPPARKFNAGQKIVFWMTILGGLSLSVSGLALLFPFQFSLFSGTFSTLNAIGFSLPTDLTALQDIQLTQGWHAVAGLIMVALIVAHIYIATIGMEGAFDAMGTGEVDENWAREHHSVWVAELEQEEAGPAGDD